MTSKHSLQWQSEIPTVSASLNRKVRKARILNRFWGLRDENGGGEEGRLTGGRECERCGPDGDGWGVRRDECAPAGKVCETRVTKCRRGIVWRAQGVLKRCIPKAAARPTTTTIYDFPTLWFWDVGKSTS